MRRFRQTKLVYGIKRRSLWQHKMHLHLNSIVHLLKAELLKMKYCLETAKAPTMQTRENNKLPSQTMFIELNPSFTMDIL